MLALRACTAARAAAPATRRFAAASAEQVFERARAMKETPYDAAKEGQISAPNYVGWDSEIAGDFKKLQAPIVQRAPYKNICESALDLIGFTPMVRMSRLAKHLEVECELLAKCEFFNAGGSVKDRIGKRMVEEAEKSGRIKPGDILIEPTSGNTGIGLCLTAALKGYKMIICLPQKMSGEKVNTMKALGAEILRTPTEAAWDAKDSHIFLSQRLAKDLGGHVLDQYKNPGNPLAHYEGTAEEIFEQTDGKLDYMVMSAGTGGTITGTAMKLKEKMPNIKIVGVDPYGSILAKPEVVNEESARTGHKKLQAYHVEGIGYDFVPTVLDQDIVDYWVKTDDDESFAMGRNVVRHEGLLIGGSCGATMAGAYKFIREHNIGKDKRVAVLFADSSRNYMSKFMDDDWMSANGFKMQEFSKTTKEKGFFAKLFGL
uniref:cystathionine beta-synthase n=2 Tax=Zooxanthella nutricula TaxID=1333877 RepID=A0A7S2JJG3_9DINO